jgi:hypothetical protein
VQHDKKGIDYVKDPKNGEALDDQKVDLEHLKAQKKEDALDLNEKKVEEYENAQKFGKDDNTLKL